MHQNATAVPLSLTLSTHLSGQLMIQVVIHANHWARWVQLHDVEEAIHNYVHNDKVRLQQIIDALQLQSTSVESAEDQAKAFITRLMFSGTVKRFLMAPARTRCKTSPTAIERTP